MTAAGKRANMVRIDRDGRIKIGQSAVEIVLSHVTESTHDEPIGFFRPATHRFVKIGQGAVDLLFIVKNRAATVVCRP